MPNPNPAISRLSEEYSSGSLYGASTGGVVTMDAVVIRTAATLATVTLSAALTWAYTANRINAEDSQALSTIGMLAFVASLFALGLSLFISFRRATSPALILLFSAVEGVTIGFFSKIVALQVGSNEPVVGAVMGTFCAAAGTLFVYKFFRVRVTDRMRRIVTIAMFAFVGVSLLSLLFSFMGAGAGVNGFGPAGFLFALLGVGLALFMLLTDFDAVERAIAYRLPEKEAWRLAFGLTVTLVWIYVNLLKILAILNRR